MGIFGVPGQRVLRAFGVGALVASSMVSVSVVAGSAPEASAVVAAPTVSGISPAVGAVAGGQQVLIWGTGFATSGTITVTINGAACTGAALALGGNATAVKCTTGAATEGIGNVVVTNPDALSGTLTNGFTYVGDGETDVLAWGYKGLGGNDVPEINYGSNLRLQRLATPIDSTGALAGRTVVGLSSGANAQHACALADNGRAYCWGRNASGQLGDGTTDVRWAPIEVSVSGVLSGKSLVSIAAAYSGSSSDGFTCAVSTEGKVYCWGYNAYGQLGDNSTTNRTSPVAVATGAASGKVFVDVKVGSDHACGLTSDGKVYCWGNNDYGQLGNNSNTAAKTPVAVNTSGTL
jgi:hypothetical protein